jgi:RNA polymerase sigma factor (sigma-70 family)
MSVVDSCSESMRITTPSSNSLELFEHTSFEWSFGFGNTALLPLVTEIAVGFQQSPALSVLACIGFSDLQVCPSSFLEQQGGGRECDIAEMLPAATDPLSPAAPESHPIDAAQSIASDPATFGAAGEGASMESVDAGLATQAPTTRLFGKLLDPTYECFAVEIESVIHTKAKKFASRIPPSQFDAGDIAQELALKVLRALPRYDSKRGLIAAFIASICERWFRTFFERHRAAKRDWRRVQRFSDDHGDHGDSEDRSFDSYSLRMLGAGRLEPLDHVSLRHDLQAAIASLSPKDRELCELLMRETIAESARIQKTSRYAVEQRMKKIAIVFTAKKFDRYF